MTRGIDSIDYAIITCLQRDSRTPSAEIARQVGVAERTVRSRIDRLVDDGMIRLIAVVNPRALGYSVTADVFLEVEIGKVQQVADTVASFPDVYYVGMTTGDRDVSLQLYAESVDELYDFVTGRLNRIPGVLRARTFVIPRIVKSISDWSLPDHVPALMMREAEPEPRRRRNRQLT
ncbi:MAG TPA: Lrp/AsnC family transcriptional regulator [Steroidobacteraceae bacterium]|nr:Lrp/AsnC family transcriptional regulator [Steroidobacteraceae bacterium]